MSGKAKKQTQKLLVLSFLIVALAASNAHAVSGRGGREGRDREAGKGRENGTSVDPARERKNNAVESRVFQNLGLTREDAASALKKFSNNSDEYVALNRVLKLSISKKATPENNRIVSAYLKVAGKSAAEFTDVPPSKLESEFLNFKSPAAKAEFASSLELAAKKLESGEAVTANDAMKLALGKRYDKFKERCKK